jgi:hypothetical protein
VLQNPALGQRVQLNQLINLAVAEKISALLTEEFFRERRARANVRKARKILKRAGEELLPRRPTRRVTSPCRLLGSWPETGFEEIGAQAVFRSTTFPPGGLLARSSFRMRR